MAAFSSYHILVFLLFLVVLSGVLTCFMIRLRIIDRPNHRSSHVQPVPRSGGAAIVLTTYLGVGLIAWLREVPPALIDQLAGIGIAAAILAFAGLLDDLGRLNSFKSKLAMQALGCAVLFPFGVVIQSLPLPILGETPIGWLAYPVTFVWVLALTNIFNFMDGLDGLASGTALIVAAVMVMLAGGGASGYLGMIGCVLFTSTLGFFVFNFPRAKIFLGDVGSQFLGFIFAGVAVLAANDSLASIPLLVIPLLFFHFIFDTVFTFCRRLFARENVTHPHKSHLYQLMNQSGLSHPQVSFFHFVVTAVQGGGAYMMLQLPAAHHWLVFLPYLVFQMLFAATVVSYARRRGVI